MKTDKTEDDANATLRNLIAASGLSQPEVLARYNEGQAKPMALRTFKTYLARADSKTRVQCPESVVKRVKAVVRLMDTVQSRTNDANTKKFSGREKRSPSTKDSVG